MIDPRNTHPRIPTSDEETVRELATEWSARVASRRHPRPALDQLLTVARVDQLSRAVAVLTSELCPDCDTPDARNDHAKSITHGMEAAALTAALDVLDAQAREAAISKGDAE